MITFEDAQQIVLDAEGEPDWVAAPYGWENDESYVVVVGQPVGQARDDAPARFVNKVTGEYTPVYGLFGELPSGLSPIGSPPAAGESWE